MASADSSQLAGKTALVTGSSSGIGRAIALELAKAGAACIVHARSSRQAAESVVESIRAAGGTAELLLADVADVQARSDLVEQAWRWRDGVDIWVNNAGADVLTGDVAKSTFEQKLELLWRVDVEGSMALSRLAGQRMKAARGGVIINIGWDQAEYGMAGESGELFAASKGAVMAFSKSLARSLAPEVRVNCVAPGWIKTAWGAKASQYWQERAVRESLLARWGTPEDIAGAVRFLVSPAASFITGHVLPVNGGLRQS